MKACMRVGFSALEILRSRPADINTGTLIFVYALRHKEAYNTGDYIPAAREFQHQIIAWNLLYKWDYTLVFDECPPAEKQHEHQRCHQKGRNSVIIDAILIAICFLVCKHYFVKYIVSPSEADTKVRKLREGGISVCCDSDEIAYGNPLVVFVNSWPREEFCVVKLCVPATDEMQMSLPIYFYFC